MVVTIWTEPNGVFKEPILTFKFAALLLGTPFGDIRVGQKIGLQL